MFFDEGKKKGLGAAILMGHSTPGGGTKDTLEDDEGDPNEALHAVAEDLVSAVHAKDVPAVAEALKAFLAVVQGEDQDEY